MTSSPDDRPGKAADTARDAVADSLYRTAFETSGVPTMVVDDDMTISLVNTEFERLSGFAKESIEGVLQWTAFVPSSEIERLKHFHRIRRIDPAAAPGMYESLFQAQNGTIHAIEVYASMIPGTRQSVVALHDITQRRQLEEELQKAQKLDSLAQMARGIAHEFNNALTIILSSVSLARQYVATIPAAVAKLREAEKEILRTKELTDNLLTFSRGGEPTLKTVQIGDIVQDTARLALIGSRIQPEFRISDDIWPCRIDTAQIAQVVSNVVLNARHAMAAGGTVLIAIENIRLENRQHCTLPSGPYLLITVRDTGIGIAADHLPQVFDPFFTTRKGHSGLGLSSSYTIIKKHNGHIDIVSEPEVGTSVYIYLPALPDAGSASAQEDPQASSRTRSILLVEEDDAAREKTALLLGEFAYVVTAVATGTKAIVCYQESLTKGERFDAVILDLSPIGREGGRGCLKALRTLDPLACVIGGSRYADSFDLAEYRKYGFAHVAQKPYNIEQLLAILRQVVEGRA